MNVCRQCLVQCLYMSAFTDAFPIFISFFPTRNMKKNCYSLPRFLKWLCTKHPKQQKFLLPLLLLQLITIDAIHLLICVFYIDVLSIDLKFYPKYSLLFFLSFRMLLLLYKARSFSIIFFIKIPVYFFPLFFFNHFFLSAAFICVLLTVGTDPLLKLLSL